MYRSIRCLFLGKPFSHVLEGSMGRAHGTWMLCPKIEHTEKRMLMCSPWLSDNHKSMVCDASAWFAVIPPEATSPSLVQLQI
jgi:hypothetical protein